jgi:hypothetical protein
MIILMPQSLYLPEKEPLCSFDRGTDVPESQSALTGEEKNLHPYLLVQSVV